MRKTLTKAALFAIAATIAPVTYASSDKPATEPKNKPFTKVVVKKTIKKTEVKKVDKCAKLKGPKKAECQEKRD